MNTALTYSTLFKPSYLLKHISRITAENVGAKKSFNITTNTHIVRFKDNSSLFMKTNRGTS